MAVEVCSYSLSLAGRRAGKQVLRSELQGKFLYLVAETHFQGVLGNAVTEQRSRFSLKNQESISYSESTQSKQEKRSFEVTFDIKNGTVKAQRRSGNGEPEVAESSYLRAYTDPLSLLFQVRRLVRHSAEKLNNELASETRFPMLGKDVLLKEAGLTTLNDATVRGFILYPGPSYIYVSTQEPYTIVRMLQPTAHGMTEATLEQQQQESGSLDTKGVTSRRRKRRRVPRHKMRKPKNNA